MLRSRVTPAVIERSASRYAAQNGFGSIDAIPPEKRDAAVAEIARSLQANEAEVRVVLGLHWLETIGRRGNAVSGGAIASASSNLARSGDRESRPVMIASAQLTAKQPPKSHEIIRRGDRILRALGSDEPAKVADQPPIDLRPDLLRKGIVLDEPVVQPGLYGAPDKKPRVGECGTIDLRKLRDGDPILDLPIYRGMGSEDPAVHALLVSGRLIPAGTSWDYEAFKTYSNRSPLDAYEWTLDPYVALKSTGGHGYLLQTTLRELKNAGKKELCRKSGDSEGGIFIASMIEPRVRSVGHVDGAFEIGRPLPKAEHPNAERFAKILAAKVPDHGGWDAFLESGEKAVQPMMIMHAEQTAKQVAFLTRRLAEKSPDDPLIDRARTAMAELNGATPGDRIAKGRELMASLKMKIAS
jgi:hypothetical protein